jgi:signal transduction histidine kinase
MTAASGPSASTGEELLLLVVDDDDADLLAVRRCLYKSGLRTAADEVRSAHEALRCLGEKRYDCILLDFYLPDMPGLDVLDRIWAAAPDVPVVMFTGRGDEDVAVELMKAGVADYLPKASLTPERLAAALRHALDLARATQARKRAEDERERLLALEQEARAKAERAARARDEVLAFVAHDLRNPLQVITGAAASLAKPMPDAKRDLYVEHIQRAARDMDRLVSDLLDVSRMDSGTFAVRPSRLDLKPLLVETLEMFERPAQERRILLEVDVEAAGAVSADRVRLLQVISNLLSNALKFTPEGGRVRLRTNPGDGEVQFAVEDTGPGIPAELLSRVFSMFWQGDRTSRDGAGLGLAIAKGIVEAHNGRIWVAESEQGGCVICFTVPSASQPH